MPINIAFVGTCQAVSLCYYLQQCVLNNPKYNISWVCYDKSFLQHLHRWSDKCQNKILDEEQGIAYIKSCNYIVYHPIDESKSPHFNTNNLFRLKNPSCQMISLQRVHIYHFNDPNNYPLYLESIQETKRREIMNKVDILVSPIFENNKYNIPLLITFNHPATYMFLSMLVQICKMLHINYITTEQYTHFMKNNNFMDLP